jgi:hypothetical protein
MTTRTLKEFDRRLPYSQEFSEADFVKLSKFDPDEASENLP